MKYGPPWTANGRGTRKACHEDHDRYWPERLEVCRIRRPPLVEEVTRGLACAGSVGVGAGAMTDRRHKVRCPDCQTAISFRPKPEHRPGTRIQLTCVCGTKLRTRIPGRPKVDPVKWLEELTSNPFTDYKL